MFLLAGLPAFIFVLELYITKKVSVLQRLLATMVSGLLVSWLTDYSLTRLHAKVSLEKGLSAAYKDLLT